MGIASQTFFYVKCIQNDYTITVVFYVKCIQNDYTTTVDDQEVGCKRSVARGFLLWAILIAVKRLTNAVGDRL